MESSADLTIELEDSQLIFEDDISAEGDAYSVAVCGPPRFVSRAEKSLRNSYLSIKTFAFAKSDRETADKISALKPASVLLDSTFAGDGVMRLFRKNDLNVIVMDSDWKKAEDFVIESGPVPDRSEGGQFLNSLSAYAAACLVWDI